ncbi:MAG TPA: DUF3592 domain-containing protein, partial [Steroidobacteraceae bacterium]|nr:DUF3592 domain-containing protein [Steroidobacteraceae bacterium]
PPQYRVGEEVAVVYLANAPGKAMIERGISGWALPLGFGLGGAFFAALGLSWIGVGRFLKGPVIR